MPFEDRVTQPVQEWVEQSLWLLGRSYGETHTAVGDLVICCGVSKSGLFVHSNNVSGRWISDGEGPESAELCAGDAMTK